MSIRTIILAGLFGAATAARATIVVSNVAATNVTTTSAWANATLVSTNGTTNAVTATLYYGTVDGTTNTSGVNGWANTNSYGAAAVGPLTVQATALTASHKYFYRWYVAEGTGTAWATPSTFWWTLSTSPTSTPTPSSIAVHAGTNGVLKAPTNFFMANSQQVAQAAAAAGALTNETDPVWTSEKSGYATGTPIYAESDPVWEAAKSGYATGTPVYAESDPVWVAAQGGYDAATQALTGRMTAVDEATTGTVAVLTGRTTALDAGSTGRVAVLETASTAIDGRVTALDAASTGAVPALTGRMLAVDEASTGTVAALTGRVLALDAVTTGRVSVLETGKLDSTWAATNYATLATASALQSATQAMNGRLTALDAASTGAVPVLDGRVTALEGGGVVSNWSAYPARQIVDVGGNSLSNVYSITAQEPGFTVLNETFDTDVFASGAWTNISGEWISGGGQLFYSSLVAVCSNTTASIVTGRQYQVIADATYGYEEVPGDTILIVNVGGVDITLTNASYGRHVTTNSIEAESTSRPIAKEGAERNDDLIVYSLLLTDITPSNSVYLPRTEIDQLTVGADTATNLPFAELQSATNALDAASKSAFQPYTATVDPGAGETVTVAYANGSLVKITATNGLTTLTFDNAAYPTAGVARVAVNLWADTNGIAFDAATITNATAPTIPTNAWKGLMFRRIEGGLWHGREY